MRIRMIAFCLGLAVTPGLALTAHAQYDVTVLQDPTGATVTVPRAINASGQSVGWSQIGSQPIGCDWWRRNTSLSLRSSAVRFLSLGV